MDIITSTIIRKSFQLNHYFKFFRSEKDLKKKSLLCKLYVMSNNIPPKGGTKIPTDQKNCILEQAYAYSLTRPWSAEYQLFLRFNGKFCYLDGKHIKEKHSFPLGRITYFDKNVWALAFFTYSNQRYEPSIYRSGKWFGNLEEAINICELYLV